MYLPSRWSRIRSASFKIDKCFEIAGKLGIHSHIIEQARSMISKEEQDVAGLIASLETRNVLAEQKKQEAEDKLQEIQAQLDALEADHAFLTEGGVFPERLIKIWIEKKRAELKKINQIPHPAEFGLYYDL